MINRLPLNAARGLACRFLPSVFPQIVKRVFFDAARGAADGRLTLQANSFVMHSRKTSDETWSGNLSAGSAIKR